MGRLVASTSKAPTCTACGEERPEELLTSRTRPPTSARASPGTRTPLTSTSRTPEVHPWHQDGLRRPQEEEGQERPDSLHQGVHRLDFQTSTLKFYPGLCFSLDILSASR